ncbi:MAG: hypothetical protein IJT59_00135 [Desulfovibrionaceae bacterium]|nr:hypothetical protein [Desulfovibrionaceae bacterium]
MKIPKGTKNIIINANGGMHSQLSTSAIGDNDLQLYTESGKHLAGTVSSDFVFTKANFSTISNLVPFRSIDESYLNTGWADYNGIGTTGKVSTYNGMTIEYTGDTENHDTNTAYVNNGSSESYYEYEILKISEAIEDLYVWYPGEIEGFLKVYYDQAPDNYDIDSVSYLSIATQEAAASSLTKIDNAIRSKDQIRAHLGAIQNRLENTITSLSIQAENMKSAEIHISDIDVASELYSFVRNKILTQSAVAMLSQAYTMPEMAMRLIVG